MFFEERTGVRHSEIFVELFWAGLTIFIADSIFGGLLGLFILLGYFDFDTIGYLLNTGVYLFLLAGGLMLLSVVLMELVQKEVKCFYCYLERLFLLFSLALRLLVL